MCKARLVELTDCLFCCHGDLKLQMDGGALYPRNVTDPTLLERVRMKRKMSKGKGRLIALLLLIHTLKES